MVKNENQLLGILISNKNINGECNHSVAVEKSGLDWEIYSFLLKNMKKRNISDSTMNLPPLSSLVK